MNKKYNELIEEVLSTSDFMSKEIRHHIKLNIKKYNHFNYQKIQYILNFMENIYDTKFKGYLIIFPTDFKKELNEQDTIPPTKLGNNITTHNINGGITIKYQNPNHKPIICIWRKEELERTLIHELIHYYNSDLLKTKKVNKFVKSLNFNINYLGNAEELMTELLTFFHCLKIRKSSDKELRQEISHSFLNSVKILKHTGHPTFSSFFVRNPKTQIKTDTSLIYYYILKGFVLFFLDPKNIPNKINVSYDDFLLRELKKITSPKYVKIIDDIMLGFKFDYDRSLRHMFY